ncbi:MAG: ABC transporter substrate-binding protein [Dehalococcoidia bacterium]|nr:ABC transporter substrate-binding protein [Dehalococcoidia bacterium]
MTTHRWKNLKLTTFMPLALTLLALLALACAPAAQPTAAPEQATPEVAAPTAPLAEAVPVHGGKEVPTTGKYIDRAGLQVFIPEGYEFGGPIIPADPRSPRYGGTFIYAQFADPPSNDPYHTTSTYMMHALSGVYEKLIDARIGPGIDPDLDVRVPGLAESWDITNDYMKYTFHLRQGVKWHNLPPVNGREFDAEDVKATWDFLRSDGSILKGIFADVDRTEVVDKYTVAMHLKKVNLGIIAVVSNPGRGWILPKEIANTTTAFNRRVTGIGTGPLIVNTDYEFKVGTNLRRNPDYWMKDPVWGNQLPYLDGRKVVVIPDASARTAAFRTGKVDAGASPTSPASMRQLMKTNPTALVQEQRLVHQTANVGFRLDKEPWKDVRVRRAMSLAIDYETWTKTVWGVSSSSGMSIAIASMWYGPTDNAPAALAKECSCDWYTYNPAKAKALLAEAGYPKGFTTSLEYSVYSTAHTETNELLSAFWKEIGVDVQVKAMDYIVWRANLDKGAWTDISGWVFTLPIPDSMYAAVQQFVPGQALNPNTGWVNDTKMTAMVKEFEASYKNEDKQKDLLRQIRAYYLDQVFSIPWARGYTYSVFSPRLRNYQPSTHILSGTDGDHGSKLAVTWVDDAWTFAK